MELLPENRTGLTFWRVTLLGLIVTAAACGKPSETSNTDRFPGFVKSSEKGPASLFLADIASIRRIDDLVTFKLVRILEKGYVIQSASTDCQGQFQGDEGVQFTNDGVSERTYAADKKPLPVDSIPGVTDLEKLVCERAEAQAKAKAEAQRVTERSLWLNGDTSCHQNVDCLVADMHKSGATPNAIDLAERLSAARNGSLAWAIELHKYGPVDLVTYDCTDCRFGGFALVNGVPNIIVNPSIDGNSLRTFAAYMSQHPNAFLLRDTGFVEQTVLDGRGQRFIFANWAGDCEACAPTAVLEYAFDFDNTGRQIGTQVVGLFAVSDVHVAFSPPGK